MPLYKDHVAQELEQKSHEFTGQFGREAVAEYQTAIEDLAAMDPEAITAELESKAFPGAVPTAEFEAADGLVIPFEESREWGSHEAVNEWARDHLEGITTIAADGSQINPISEFEQTVGLVQVVWMTNHHAASGEYDEAAETVVLTPEDLLYEDPNTGQINVDEQEVPLTRFETEIEALEAQVTTHSEADPPPVVLYDGSLILSFIQMFDQKAQQRYSEALARLLAASRHHGVPVVGYVSGSKATELSTLMQTLDLVETSQRIRDYQLLTDALEQWGDRTPLFAAHRDQTQHQLQTTYHGTDYDFSEKILFTYMDIGPGPQLDRIALPEWIHTQDLTEYVLSVVRAEAAVGRGYPEILQAVDADAVISRQDRQEFLRMYQEFSAAHDLDLEWNTKALSKERRRR